MAANKRKHSRRFRIAVVIAIILVTGCIIYFLLISPFVIRHPYVQEYTSDSGGSVRKSEFTGISQIFDIGADENGTAVFKDPKGAFKYLRQNYSQGIDLIREEFHLKPLTQYNYQQYAMYGWQVTTEEQLAREQAFFITRFLDIYENSFR